MKEGTKLYIASRSSEKIPKLISGNDALKVYNSLSYQTRIGLNLINYQGKLTMVGSTPIAVANLDSFAKGDNTRTPNLRDLSRSEVMELIDKEYYIDARDLIVRSIRDSDQPKNNSLLKTIYELAEQKLGKISGPFMISGFRFVLDKEDNNGYGLIILPTSGFSVIGDERFGGKYNGQVFSEVDEFGIPRFDKEGKRNWWAKKDGLSRICLVKNLDLYSGNECLTDSCDKGRVVFLK